MTPQPVGSNAAGPAAAQPKIAPRPVRPKFPKEAAFNEALRRRVDAYFESTGQSPRDCRSMYVKTAVILAIYFGAYLLLVFVAEAWWQAVPLAVLLGLAGAAIGLNVQHDAGHHAYSRHPWINSLMAKSLDLLGASSYLWHGKHVVLHHTYTNVTGHDTDVDLGFLGRLTPHQPRLAIHRWQHYYL